MKQKLFVRIVSIVLVVMLVVSVGFVAFSSFMTSYAAVIDDNESVGVTTGYVSGDYVNLRSDAGTNYSVVTCMRKNTKFTFVSTTLKNTNWYNIKLNDGKSGYVHKYYVKKNSASNQPNTSTSETGYITEDYVNLRSGAGTSYSVVTCMRKNTKFTFVSTTLKNTNWYNIKLNDGKKGYVHKDYVKKNSVPATGVSLNKTSLSLQVGKTYTLVATISPSNADKSCTYTSSDKSVATVSSSGKITAVKAGKANITVKTQSGKTAVCSVTVSAANQSPTQPSTETGYITEDYVNLRSGAGTSYSVVTCMRKNTKFTFVSTTLKNTNWYNIKLDDGKSGYVHKDYVKKNSASNQPNTSTSETGYITEDYVNLRSGAGTSYSVVTCMRKNTKFTFISTTLKNTNWYNIKLNDGKKGYVHKDYVKKNSVPATGVSLNKTSLSLQVGKTYTLVATISPSNADKSCTYTSSDKSVATVSGSGKITAVKAGKANITVKTQSGKTAVCSVTVSAANQPPTQPATQKPTQSVGSNVKLSDTSKSLYTGNQFILKATASGSVSWSSSNTNTATVSGGIVTAKNPGTAVITAKCGTASAKCNVTVKNGSKVTISNDDISIRCKKSIRLTSNSSVSWSSSDTSIATVKNGIVDTVGKGKVIITASASGGAATCLITVEARDNVRFCYASPNSSPLNSKVTFKAITDTDRNAVRFVVSNGSTSYTVDADKKVKDGDNYIWTGSKTLSKSGKWTVKAYSRYKTSNQYLTTPVNGEGEVFVTSSTDKNTTVCSERRASDEVINLIANYEGFLSSVTADYITSDPTLGYGKVVTSGEQFYNHLTKNEAYAYLCQTVNSGGYTTRTNKYLLDNGIKYNQRQFDALVCFTYNVGAGVFYNDSTIQSVLLNTGSGSNAAASGKSGYVNSDGVNLRSGAGTSYSVLVCMDKNTKFTFVDGKIYNSNWYKIKLSNGVTGYIYSTYASVSGGSRDLNNIVKQDYLNAFLQYHHAANSCYWGLLYRRVDEAEVFFYADYDRDGEYNYNHFKFTCYGNKNFSIS